jgi:hypothetical protein
MSRYALLLTLGFVLGWFPFSSRVAAEAAGGADWHIAFNRDIKPILDARCVVCHGCYDAPCQLKLESGEGLERGASKTLVYDLRRDAIAPTRLFVDARNTAEWRQRGFYSVLDGQGTDGLAKTLLFRMLRLKKDQPLPEGGALPDSFDFSLDRSLQCPKPQEFADFAADHPLWGMPYGMPGLPEKQFGDIVTWLRHGARMEPPPAVSAFAAAEVERWEAFLNGESLKERLVSRYLYEHLFAGDLHFRGGPEREFFKLVRSYSPPGFPIREIASVRPFDDPGAARFYYRLRPIVGTIVDKNHMVYELSGERMQRYRTLFLDPDYHVTRLPGYQPEIAANPFKAFVALPPKSRYQFLLDDAYFFIEGFMKGPVCRGQVALNVIQDHFWVAFFDPDKDRISNDAHFLLAQGERLRLPTEKLESPTVEDIWSTYSDLQLQYLKAKEDYISKLRGGDSNTLAALWDGDGHNNSALLTVFRHFDSASLSHGLIGAVPKTAWVLDYPLMERIHYLLVAGYDVFGSLRHQLATRLFMDFMRMEAENNFLGFLPAAMRQRERDSWYRGVAAEISNDLKNPLYGLDRETGVVFHTQDPKRELFTQLRTRPGQAANAPDVLNRCEAPFCVRPDASPEEQRAERELRVLARLKGGGIHLLPELSYIRIRSGGGDLVYSLILNKALKNVAFLFLEDLRRRPQEDTLTVLAGFAGSFPNFFFDLELPQVADFVQRIIALKSESDVSALVDAYGVRRNSQDFWPLSDWFYERYAATQPIVSGRFDLNRYDNL